MEKMYYTLIMTRTTNISKIEKKLELARIKLNALNTRDALIYWHFLSIESELREEIE